MWFCLIQRSRNCLGASLNAPSPSILVAPSRTTTQISVPSTTVSVQRWSCTERLDSTAAWLPTGRLGRGRLIPCMAIGRATNIGAFCRGSLKDCFSDWISFEQKAHPGGSASAISRFTTTACVISWSMPYQACPGAKTTALVHAGIQSRELRQALAWRYGITQLLGSTSKTSRSCLWNTFGTWLAWFPKERRPRRWRGRR
mmetsp:Transcript_69371/g.162418  ORF Transcript_69371/g.162418 Transcript_69371/m.162418 type:complete len:200 (-) Transcript_69371:948-1547(-)